MRLTLTLHDYMMKYIEIKRIGESWCPLCYEHVLTDSRTTNMSHMMECYKDLLIEKRLRRYHDQHGEYPVIDEHFAELINKQSRDEMMLFVSKYIDLK